ncbi:MAG: hypothetical protein JW875_04710 [Spirochaetales bacterium]|nr:hypothetical protein [Spirochaetales bacterium]
MKRLWLLVTLVLLTAIAVRIGYMTCKDAWHVDEGITLALTNSSWLSQAHPGLMERWHDKADLEEMVFNGNLSAARFPDVQAITDRTALDVHPPLFYWLFALSRKVVGPEHWRSALFLLNGLLFLASGLCFLAIARRVFKDDTTVLLALALFVFSSTTVSLTLFARMYELLQFSCLAFLASAVYIVFPGSHGTSGFSRGVGIVCLCLSAWTGLLTHYYFLFFVFSVSLVSLVVLIARRDWNILLWSLFAVVFGLFLASWVFPPLERHLLYSNRAMDGYALLARLRIGMISERALHYGLLLCRHIPALIVGVVSVVVCVLLSLTGRYNLRGRSKQGIISFIFFAITCVGSCGLAAAASPFYTLRYVASFSPAIILCLVAGVVLYLPRTLARRILVVSLILTIAPGLFPGNMSSFDEEYRRDRNPLYFKDPAPVIIVSHPEGFTWKNMIAYASIPRGKKVYVTLRYTQDGLERSLVDILQGSGSSTGYAMVDVLFPALEGIPVVGIYGFFKVYKLEAR